VVGLSTEDSPSSLTRQECPAIQNVEVDRGGVCRTRDGYERLSSTQVKDSSWRLRGSPYNATLFHEYYDAIVIPHHSDYNVSAGTTEFLAAITVKFEASGVGTTLQQFASGDTYVLSKGNSSSSANHPFRLFLDYNAGAIRWNASIYDGVSATLYTAQISDTLLTAAPVGSQRYVEVSVQRFVSGTIMRLLFEVHDPNSGQIGSTVSVNIGATWSLTSSNPWIIGAYPNSSGYPTVAATHEYLMAKVAEFRLEVGNLTIDKATLGYYKTISSELIPSVYSASTIKGYWKLNDGDYARVYDSCDTVENAYYTGSRKGNHGKHWNIAPQWIRSDNTIQIASGSNSNVTDGSQGVRCLYRNSLMFSGLQGHVQARSGSVVALSTQDPLQNIFQVAPAANVGWTAQIVCTLLMERGATTYPDGVIYDSGPTAYADVNPIRVSIVSNQFKLWFKDTVTTNTVTITSHNVSDFAGEMITIHAYRNNTTITFMVIGENKTTTPVTIVTANTGSASSSIRNGPFVYLGRGVATTLDTTSDTPSTFSGNSIYGVFHEYRLWSEPIGYAYANMPVPQGARSKLAVYLVADAGYGNQLSNYGTSVRVVIPTITVGTNVYSQNSFLDSRCFPPQECGPIPSEGLVTPFFPVRVQGAIDFRNIVGERVTRQLVYLAGSCLYTYDAKTATVASRSGGIFKKPGLFSMENFDGNVYFTNGGRPKVWDGNEVRFAGIEAPIQRPYMATGDTSNAGGTLDDGSYLIGYRFVNTRSGYKSNISPLVQFTLSGGAGNASKLVGIHGLEVPHDPQVNAIEVLCTLEGSAARLYKIGITTDVTTGSFTFPTAITSLTTTSSFVDITSSLEVPSFGATTTYGDIYKYGAPPPSKCLGLLGSRMLYAATYDPGTVYFSRVDGGPQVEHVDVTPGLSGSVAIKTDAGDEVQAMSVLDDSMFVYLRDSRAEISLTGLDPTSTGGLDIPFQVAIRDNDIGTVSPYSVVAVTGSHAFFSETDIYVRSRSDYRIISSPGSNPGAATQPRIGRTIRALDGDYLYLAVAMHRQARQQIWFAVTEEGSVRNNAILIYSYRERKWTRYLMPYIDMMLEVEMDGDKRVPVGFINGYVCKLDVTNRAVDSYDSVLPSGMTTAVAAVSGTAITLGAVTSLDEGQLAGRPVWFGNGGSYTQYVIAHNDDNNGSTRIYLYATSVDSNVAVIKNAYVGSIFPSIDFMINPSSETQLKRFRELEIAADHEGMTNLELVAWFDYFKFDPPVSSAVYKGRAMAFSSTSQQYIKADVLGMGRIGRYRLQAPAPGKGLNISEIRTNYEKVDGGRFFG